MNVECNALYITSLCQWLCTTNREDVKKVCYRVFKNKINTRTCIVHHKQQYNYDPPRAQVIIDLVTAILAKLIESIKHLIAALSISRFSTGAKCYRDKIPSLIDCNCIVLFLHRCIQFTCQRHFAF